MNNMHVAVPCSRLCSEARSTRLHSLLKSLFIRAGREANALRNFTKVVSQPHKE
jgi:hypothetical protein